MPEEKASPQAAYTNQPSEPSEETIKEPPATKAPEAVVHGLPESQQEPEKAIAVDMPMSIPVVQVDTGLPQSEANVTPQNPYGTNDPAILPKDVNPRVVPVPGEGEVATPIVPTSETHLSGQPVPVIAEETEPVAAPES